MLYVNLIWIWGHPEVYILVLPIFGVFSEVTATFCSKRPLRLLLDGLRHRRHWHPVLHRVAAPLLSRWVGRFGQLVLRHHHDGDLDPEGAKMFNWLFTMYKGRIRFRAAHDVTVAFMLTFVIGGMTGVMLAVPRG